MVPARTGKRERNVEEEKRMKFEDAVKREQRVQAWLEEAWAEV